MDRVPEGLSSPGSNPAPQAWSTHVHLVSDAGLSHYLTSFPNCKGDRDFAKGRRDQERKGGKGKEGLKKRMKMCYVHKPTPHNACKH